MTLSGPKILFWHKQVGIPLSKEMSASVGGHEAYMKKSVWKPLSR